MEVDIEKWLSGLQHSGCPDEFETKVLLDHFGIPSPHGLRLDPNETFDSRIIQPPYVLKVCSSYILHKTDQGGILLNVSADKVEPEIRNLKNKFPDTPVLVEEHISFHGPEFIVGALMDPSFGPAVMVGAGGILTELLKDVAFRLVPCSVRETRNMLDELMVSPIFKGFRGFECDANQLAEIISRVAKLVLSLKDRFSQLDINPIVYIQDRWTALDAKLVLNTI